MESKIQRRKLITVWQPLLIFLVATQTTAALELRDLSGEDVEDMGMGGNQMNKGARSHSATDDHKHYPCC